MPTISGTVSESGTTLSVEVFVNRSCSAPEGKTFPGTATPSSGRWSLPSMKRLSPKARGDRHRHRHLDRQHFGVLELRAGNVLRLSRAGFVDRMAGPPVGSDWRAASLEFGEERL